MNIMLNHPAGDLRMTNDATQLSGGGNYDISNSKKIMLTNSLELPSQTAPKTSMYLSLT